jgi:hypothetical protein
LIFKDTQSAKIRKVRREKEKVRERMKVKFLIPLRKKPTQFILASPNGLVVITYG